MQHMHEPVYYPPLVAFTFFRFVFCWFLVPVGPQDIKHKNENCQVPLGINLMLLKCPLCHKPITHTHTQPQPHPKVTQNLWSTTAAALQDFLKEVDIRFMDQLRRGASIVATDLARAPQPASLRDCYQLMCLTAPEVDQIEASISTIKEEIDMRKAAVADKETLLANHNPPVFQAVQVCSCTLGLTALISNVV